MLWHSNLFSYEILKALAFRTEVDFKSALERVFKWPALCGMPGDLVGGRTMIVPAGAVAFFSDLRCEVQEVASPGELTIEEIQELRREQGHH